MSGKGNLIKNRAPAPVQITAEQLLREAYDRGFEASTKAPKQFITDKDELTFYQQGKRKDFEDQLQRKRSNIGLWCKYAMWEASQLEFERARSVFERALDVDYQSPTIWLKYAEMEMKNKFINHARNIWDRAVTLLPRVDNFWYKYSYMEEMVGAIDNARQIFERWMAWEPDDLAWGAYIKFEVRQGQIERARQLYERYVKLWPTARAYLKYAKWEEDQRERELARKVYERSLEEIHYQERTEKLIMNFARFEERCKEFERARVIYQYALSTAESKGDAQLEELKAEYLAFEKRHGEREDIEEALFVQRREQYENILSKNSRDYDTWFDYLQLEEMGNNTDRLRVLYERSIQQVPLIQEKKYWKRYIYLWLNYAAFEELVAKDIDRARSVYRRCLDLIPHKLFTFGKIWLQAAQLEVRCKNLDAARKLLGQAIGMCGKQNIYKGYIHLELQLGEMDRCRTLYSKYVSAMPYNCSAWHSFAQLEISLGESTRARSIYELAIAQPELDMPELLWKSYIEFEISENEVKNVRALYERLLNRTAHVKVWISYSLYEFERGRNLDVSDPVMEEEALTTARKVFRRGYDFLKKEGLKEERVLLLESWRDMESDALRLRFPGSGDKYLAEVEQMFPKKVKAKSAEDGLDNAYDLVFPDDEEKLVGLKMLEKALAWKKKIAAPSSEPNGQEDAREQSPTLGKRPYDIHNETIDLDI